jgi:hypothetical protein
MMKASAGLAASLGITLAFSSCLPKRSYEFPELAQSKRLDAVELIAFPVQGVGAIVLYTEEGRRHLNQPDVVAFLVELNSVKVERKCMPRSRIIAELNGREKGEEPSFVCLFVDHDGSVFSQVRNLPTGVSGVSPK